MSLLFSLLVHLLVLPAPLSSAEGAPPAAAVVSQAEGDPEFTIAQLQYDGGGDWYANPSGLPNLLRAIRERTNVRVSEHPGRVKLTDAALWNYPYLYMTGHGNVRFTEEEVGILRQYLLAGGFLHVDDNYGLDESFRREIRRVFPEQDLVELPVSHPVYHGVYDFPQGLPKIHQHDGKPAQGFGLFHEGRLILFYSYESDLGNGWEDPETYGDSPERREAALRMGVNLFLHALSQVVS
jgi:hypothetical protein